MNDILRSVHPLDEKGRVIVGGVDISDYDLRCIKDELYSKKYKPADYRDAHSNYDVYHAAYNLKGEALSYLFMDFWR